MGIGELCHSSDQCGLAFPVVGFHAGRLDDSSTEAHIAIVGDQILPEFLDDFPSITREHAIAFLEAAMAALITSES